MYDTFPEEIGNLVLTGFFKCSGKIFIYSVTPLSYESGMVLSCANVAVGIGAIA